ncbi:MAG: hypothetical protein R6U98_12170 [Pirellulaceae bacterium]
MFWHELSGWRLILFWLQDPGDIRAVRIREYWKSGERIDEIVEVPGIGPDNLGSGLLHGIALGVRKRSGPSVTAEAKQTRPLTAEEAEREGLSERAIGIPRLLMALPSDEVVVIISLIDGSGREGPAVEAVVRGPVEKEAELE